MCVIKHSLGLCETDFVHSVELSPALGEVDTFFVLQFIVSKVDEGEILEVETTVKEGGSGGVGREGKVGGGEERGGEGREGKVGGGHGRGGEERGGEGRGGVNKCLWESGHR